MADLTPDQERDLRKLIETGHGVLRLGPSPDDRMPAVVYARRSKAGGTSVEDQIYGQLEFAEENNIWVAAIVLEHGSASRHARRERKYWPAVRDMIADHEVRMLMMFENSRSSRQLEGYVELRAALVEAEALWEYGERIYDMTDSTDRQATSRDAVEAENESENISKRNRRTTKAQARRGKPHGVAGWGFKRTYDLIDGKRVVSQFPDPKLAPIIRASAQLMLEKQNSSAVIRWLTEQGIVPPRGGKWDTTKFRAAISRPALAGFREHNGVIVSEADWEPILDDDREKALQIHNKLLALFAERSGKKYTGAAIYLCTGHARCGRCGGPCYARNNPKKHRNCSCGANHSVTSKHLTHCNKCGKELVVQRGKDRMIYFCYDNDCVGREIALVDEVVTEYVIGLLSRPDALDLFKAPDDPELARMQAEFDTIQDQLADYRRRAATLRISADTMEAVEAELLPKMKRLETRLQRVYVPQVVADIAGPDVRALWNQLTILQKRAVLRAVTVVEILPVGKGRKVTPESVGVSQRQYRWEDESASAA